MFFKKVGGMDTCNYSSYPVGGSRKITSSRPAQVKVAGRPCFKNKTKLVECLKW
jgi:hypothetical protein